MVGQKLACTVYRLPLPQALKHSRVGSMPMSAHAVLPVSTDLCTFCLLWVATRSKLTFFLQAGKALWLHTLVPAVVRQHPVFGVGAPKEVLVFRLDLGRLTPEQVSMR
jgi:hypothetical protein